ncbi:MAG TPA: hypothetical protein VFQ06_04880 [Nitrospira sp.]|nr:hypothetical protein [Nitrospira sp.]
MSTPSLSTELSIYDTENAGAFMRIGRVISYDAGSITIAISGSGVLTNASYLIGQYEPALGDNVVIERQGNQWVALGTLSANPPDNRVVNPSFEDGTLTAIPDFWTLYHDPASTESANVGVSALPAGWQIDGPRAVEFFLDSSPPGTSIDYLSSDAVPVSLGQRWAASAYVVGNSLSGPPCVRGQASLLLTWYADGADVYPTVVQQDVVAVANIAPTLPWIYLRNSSGGTNGVPVPEGVSHVRVTLLNSVEHVSCATNLSLSTYWDRIILRQVA